MKDELVIEANLSNDLFIEMYITIWSGIYKLTDSEKQLFVGIITEYIDLMGKFDSKEALDLLFSARFRNKIREKLSISTALFNNRLKFLVKKKIVIYKDGNYYIEPKLIPSKKLVFKFNIN